MDNCEDWEVLVIVWKWWWFYNWNMTSSPNMSTKTSWQAHYLCVCAHVTTAWAHCTYIHRWTISLLHSTCYSIGTIQRWCNSLHQSYFVPLFFLLDCSSDRMSWWLSLGQGHHNLTRCCTIPTSSVELTMTDAKTNSLVLSSENWNIHKGGRGSGLVCLVIVFGFYAPFSILYVSIKVIPRQSLGAIKVVALGVPLRGRF